MGSVVVEDEDFGDDEGLVVEPMEPESVELVDHVAQSDGLVDDTVEDLDGDARELSDYREVLADREVSVADWGQMDWSERLERVRDISYELVNSDADQQLKNDAAQCADFAGHIEVIPENTLEHYSYALSLDYKLREMGFLVDEDYDRTGKQSMEHEAVDDSVPEMVDDFMSDVSHYVKLYDSDRLVVCFDETSTQLLA